MTKGERLLKLFNYMKENDLVKNKESFCKYFDIDYSHLNTYFKDQRTLYIKDSMYDGLEHIGVSPRWFFTGKGEMFNNEEKTSSNSIIGNNNTEKKKKRYSKQIKNIIDLMINYAGEKTLDEIEKRLLKIKEASEDN